MDELGVGGKKGRGSRGARHRSTGVARGARRRAKAGARRER